MASWKPEDRQASVRIACEIVTGETGRLDFFLSHLRSNHFPRSERRPSLFCLTALGGGPQEKKNWAAEFMTRKRNGWHSEFRFRRLRFPAAATNEIKKITPRMTSNCSSSFPEAKHCRQDLPQILITPRTSPMIHEVSRKCACKTRLLAFF